MALLIETTRSYTRDLLRGVRRYMSEHEPWSVFMELRALESAPPPWLRSWKGHGVISRSGSQATIDAIRRTRLPAVEVRATKLRHPFPFIGADNRAIGRMAAEHLLERGYTRFAVYELDTEVFFEERREAFIHAVTSQGHSCCVSPRSFKGERPRRWEHHQAALVDWLRRLPKPIGVLACTDQLGFWLLDAAQRAGVVVPEECAVVGVENDQSLCAMSTPPLSSVQLPGLAVGYAAAELLDKLMRGGRGPRQPMLIPPLGVVTRQSSDIVAIADQAVARAVRFIRESALRGIDVEDVLDHVPMSRSSLERRMRSALGRSPKAEILRVRLAAVQRLLVETDLTLDALARRAGFDHPQYMSTLFRREVGLTPGEYRRQARR